MLGWSVFEQAKAVRYTFWLLWPTNQGSWVSRHLVAPVSLRYTLLLFFAKASSQQKKNWISARFRLRLDPLFSGLWTWWSSNRAFKFYHEPQLQQFDSEIHPTRQIKYCVEPNYLRSGDISISGNKIMECPSNINYLVLKLLDTRAFLEIGCKNGQTETSGSIMRIWSLVLRRNISSNLGLRKWIFN